MFAPLSLLVVLQAPQWQKATEIIRLGLRSGSQSLTQSPYIITLSKPIGIDIFCSSLWENQGPQVGDGRLGSLFRSHKFAIQLWGSPQPI